MASSDDGSRKGDNCEGTNQELMTTNPREVTSVLEEKEGTDNTALPTDISMLHDYAMDHVFSFLTMTDLKNCRLVNRFWNLVSNRVIQKKDFAIELPEHGLYVGGNYLVSEKIPKLVQLIRTSFQFPWTKFKVDAEYITSDEDKRQLANLLQVISPFATEVQIDELQDVPNVEYPNLRKLKLWYDSSTAVPKGSSRKSLLRLVERASKLNDVHITGTVNTPLYLELLEIPNCRKITRLSLSRWIEGRDLITIGDIGLQGLQLKFLSLALELKKVSAFCVQAILWSQRTCLEELALSSGEEDFPKPGEEIGPRFLLGMECPRMEKLKVLTVYSVNLYSHISYSEMFPALKKLTFWAHQPYSIDSFFNDDIEPVETVEYLKLAYWPRNPETILQAARQFPKLRRVFLSSVNRSLLNLLGHAMPELEELELQIRQEYDDMDSILTGFSSEEVETLKGLPANQLDVLERSKHPVHFLKNLRRLRISSRLSGEEPLPLSDFGCRFAFLKMKHLRILELKGNFSQISQQVIKRMRERFILCLETD